MFLLKIFLFTKNLFQILKIDTGNTYVDNRLAVNGPIALVKSVLNVLDIILTNSKLLFHFTFKNLNILLG